jgi:hypothetical protein
MSARTRYFVIASLLVLGVGLGTGLVAYYVGFPAGAFSRKGGPGPEELQYVPREATVLAYANVRDIMLSEFRQKLRRAVPIPENGQRELEEQTGINIETDIDHVVAYLTPGQDGAMFQTGGAVIARGIFNDGKIEALMREHGAQVEIYRTKRLVVMGAGLNSDAPDSSKPRDGREGTKSFACAFMEPGLIALGSTPQIHETVDLHQLGDNPRTGLEGVTGNTELMGQVRSLESGNAWAVGRFDALQSHAHLPADVAGRLPAITWFSVRGHINGGIQGLIRAETRDEDAATNLRDVVRGFMALAKLQAGSRPEFQTFMQSLELGGTGRTVTLSFVVPAEIFDAIGALAGQVPNRPQRR